MQQVQVDGSTPKTTRSTRTPKLTLKPTPKPNKPVLNGTSANVIGKPLSPNRVRTNVRVNVAPKPEKAIWISRLDRDTTEDEMTSYIRDTIGISSIEQCQIRKLVKKDKDLETYSFVSFKVACPASIFKTLMDAEKWPSYCQIREFDLDLKTSTGDKPAKLIIASSAMNLETTTENPSSSKNEVQTPNVNQVTIMDIMH